jgi:hypothetical protein
MLMPMFFAPLKPGIIEKPTTSTGDPRCAAQKYKVLSRDP